MNTQNTPVHIRLWHRDFWLMAIANLLLTVAVYALIPVMPGWLMQTENLTLQETGMIMGAFGVAAFPTEYRLCLGNFADDGSPGVALLSGSAEIAVL